MYGSEEMTAAHERYGSVVDRALRVKAIACYAHLVTMRYSE